MYLFDSLPFKNDIFNFLKNFDDFFGFWSCEKLKKHEKS